MIGKLITPAVFAAVAGAVLAFGTFGIVQAGGSGEREEAVVETRNDVDMGMQGRRYDLVLRTASGERLATSGGDRNLDLQPGTPVLLEISKLGRSVRAVEADGRRTATLNSPAPLGIVVVFIAAPLLLLTLGAAASAGRPALATLSVTAGLAAGALPVLLLF
ncbi:hypothetical protein ACWED2_37665 [Amycolatopsis sp. NPDC005003]